MTDPKRAERHWLAIAIATLWQVSVGGAVDANLPINSLDELPKTHVARRNFKNSVFHRSLSCFRRGFLVIKAAVLNRLPLPQGRFFPLALAKLNTTTICLPNHPLYCLIFKYLHLKGQGG
ncbi:MAG: hypothetical protein HC815_22835 [Richelia sp. RM1_1_1]|nr:hypothetical protein [Richelia sp. SM1_7_0]NJN10665.1 hypothetical protein [Richelia sp. RM1_1_1]